MKIRRSVTVLFFGVFAGSVAADNMRFVTEIFPPFSMEEGGKATGPIADIVRQVCQRLKTECVIEVLPWRRAMSMAEKGEVDGIYPSIRNAEREKAFYLGSPIVDTAYSLFAADSSKFVYKQPADLIGYSVGVYGPSGTSKTLEEATQGLTGVMTTIELDNGTVLKKLLGGRYGDKGLGMLNRDVGNYLIKQDGIKGVKVVGDLKKIQYHIGLSRNKLTEQQAAKFNDALKALSSEGKLKAILDKYGLMLES